MAAPNSSSKKKGFLTPFSALSQEEREDIFHELILGLTGLPSTLVQPRYQRHPPSLAGVNDNWCAFGITAETSPAYSQVVNERTSGNNISMRVLDFKDAHVLVSFYGPNAINLASAMHAGLQISQNRDFLRPFNMSYKTSGPITSIYEPWHNAWLHRADLPITFSCGPIHNKNSTSNRNTQPLKNEGSVNIKSLRSAPVVINKN